MRGIHPPRREDRSAVQVDRLLLKTMGAHEQWIGFSEDDG